MTDARKIMRAIALGLAPEKHRGLPYDDLRRLGYGPAIAKALVLAHQEQQQAEHEA